MPINPTWVWIEDLRWLSICSNLFPSVLFLDRNVDLLLPVNILLLSRIILSQCNLVLDQCLVSLLLSSSRLPSIKGWVHHFWRVKHSLLGEGTDGNWTVFSLYLSSFLDVPSSISQLPPGNVKRIVEEKLGGGIIVTGSKIESSIHRFIDSLFPCKDQSTTFFDKFLFVMTGWRARSLHIVELLALRNYLVVMVKLLSHRHQKLLW